ncbi:Long-chain-fatty-acid--CoA ligase [Pseudoalteromonas luteoviolacea B = ATCC 29581]|nr:Long-chain-fatty-acid--CoA ligase [Pseudoalteromonas luteoviolacea B = ATCC 29581]
MNPLLEKCTYKAGDIVFSDLTQSLSFSQLERAVACVSEVLTELGSDVIATQLDNSIAWNILDLALLERQFVHLPLPGFFTHQQSDFALSSAGCQLLITDIERSGLDLVKECHIAGVWCYFYSLPFTKVRLPLGTKKITFTSGSTGTPKGVCLSLDNQLNVAFSLAKAIALTSGKHLSVLPYGVLLENVAGVYASLLSKGQVVCMTLEELGFSGTSLADPRRLLTSITHTAPASMILVPELLKALVIAAQKGWQAPTSLAFIAVGGANVALELLNQAQQLGLPVYQGYGLSEAGSVVALNLQAQNGEVGKVLDHLEYKIRDNALFLRGTLFLGYLGEEARDQNTWLDTGDLVMESASGLSILGRKKNVIINSFGRNIHPEWPESLVLSDTRIMQCVVVGEAKPFLTALIFAEATVTTLVIEHLLAQINRQLPVYAQIHRVIRLSTPLHTIPGLLTGNGRPIRGAIETHFHAELDAVYRESMSA